jgi:transposase
VPKYLQHPHLYPCTIWSRLICGVSFPPTCQRDSRCCQVRTCICKMRCRWPFTRPSHACGLARGDVGNAWSKRLGTIARSMALVWWTGAMAGSTVGSRKARTADVFCEQVRAAVTRSKQRGRVAIVIADNLKTHTSAGSLLVRRMLTELPEHLYLVYTPAYDPDANRIEWLWRVSRRVVTQNHHRGTFEVLIWTSIFSRWLRLPQRCCGISAVRLPRTKIRMLRWLSLRPHNHLGSI